MDILRKYGKEVWLITKEGDAQRPIFTNCTDNIIALARPRKSVPKKDKKVAKIKEKPLKAEEKVPPKEEDEEKAKDDIANELFKKVLISLDASEEHKINAIANKMRQLNKSFKIKNTKYKKMTTLAKDFEKKGWFKTHKNKDGHLIITDIEAPG